MTITNKSAKIIFKDINSVEILNKYSKQNGKLFMLNKLFEKNKIVKKAFN
jgi:hypothetical protein